MSDLKYKRILLKVSGEALAGAEGTGLDFTILHKVCASIKECVDMGVQVGLVIGGGNFWRGVKNGAGKLQRSHGDAMGMLATVMNAIAVADVLEQHGLDARVLTAVEMNKFAEYFTRDTAERYLNEGKVVLFAAGTGNPYFSTDTGAVLRGVEIEADAILMAKNVDAIYSADPKKDPNAIRYSQLTYGKVLEDNGIRKYEVLNHGEIRIYEEIDDTSKIVAALVGADVAVYELASVQRTLEQYYLNRTGGNV